MKMEKPTVEAVRFTSADAIATSGQLGVMLSGLGDSISPESHKNNTFTVGGKNYTPANSSQEQVIKALEGAGQTPGLSEWLTIFNVGGSEIDLGDLWVMDDTEYIAFNGTYTWYPAGEYWMRSGN